MQDEPEAGECFSGLENQSRYVSKGIPAALPVSMIPVVSRRARK